MSSNTTDPSETRDALAAVRRALLGVDRTLREQEIHPSTSLLDDLGLDSAKLMDLMLALEDLLGVPEVPVLEWVEEQRASVDARFTVASLAGFCRGLMERR